MAKQRIMFVGGGTGGHFYPLIAVAETIRAMHRDDAKQPLLYYIGPDPYDKKALVSNDIRFLYCPAGKHRRYKSVLNILDSFKVLSGIFVALTKLFYIYPDVVVSKGGYTSVPVVIAAWLLRIPIIVHESDAVAGSANKLASRFARIVAISYPDSAGIFPPEKTILTGIPVRKALLSPIEANADAELGIDSTRPTLLILGGSQGAERLNTLILDALDELLPRYNIIHQTGERSFDNITSSVSQLVSDQNLLEHYYPKSFLEVDTLNQALHVASLIISRAGSGSIYEISLHEKPAILIPIPGEISHDQRTNAYAYARTGAATVMEEDNLEDGLLEAEIDRIMGDIQTYEGMKEAARLFARNDAAEMLATEINTIANEH